jgi:hypothetical protein
MTDKILIDRDVVEQEPVAWMHRYIDCNFITHRPADLDKYPTRWIPLYTHPPRREWVSLTDEEIECEWAILPFKSGWLCFARSIEAALKEKNNG